MSIWVKRAALVAISIVIGFVMTYAVVYFDVSIAGIPLTLNTNFDDYTYIYTFLTTGSIAIAVGVWLDKFMATQILPE